MSVKSPLGLVLYCYLNMPTINKTYLILSYLILLASACGRELSAFLLYDCIFIFNIFYLCISFSFIIVFVSISILPYDNSSLHVLTSADPLHTLIIHEHLCNMCSFRRSQSCTPFLVHDLSRDQQYTCHQLSRNCLLFMSTILHPELSFLLCQTLAQQERQLNRECHEHMSLHPGLVGFAFPNLWVSVQCFVDYSIYSLLLSLFILHDHVVYCLSNYDFWLLITTIIFRNQMFNFVVSFFSFAMH